jgi:hypothetical protein
MRDGFVARYHGYEYEASPAGEQVLLYSTEPTDGFTEVRPGRYRRAVPADDIDSLAYARTGCTWRGEPFIVLGEHGGWLRLEYTGGKAPVARALGLEEFEYGVYQGWAPAAEVADIGELRI